MRCVLIGPREFPTTANVAPRGVRLVARLSGMSQRTTIEQTYVYSEPEAIEAVYTFPLPESAAVCGFEVMTGEHPARPRAEHCLYRPRHLVLVGPDVRRRPGQAVVTDLIFWDRFGAVAVAVGVGPSPGRSRCPHPPRGCRAGVDEQAGDCDVGVDDQGRVELDGQVLRRGLTVG